MSKKNTFQENIKLIYFFIFGILIGLLFYVIFFKFNYLWVDITGHIASSKIFWTSGYHNFFDGWFLGYVQNLFYPPMEDLLIGIFSGFGMGDFIMGFKIYLFVMLIVYIWSMFRLSKFVENNFAKIIFFFLATFFLCMEKPGLTQFQGMGLFDTFITGLSSQMLGGIFMFLIIYELFENKDKKYLGLLIALTLLSHLVVGPLTVGLIIFYIILDKRWYLIKHLILGIGLSSFFLIPFILNRGLISNTSIFYASVPLTSAFVILLTIMLIFFFKKKTLNVLLFAGICFMIPTEVFKWTGFDIFPKFHYYRLAVFSLFFMFLGLVFLLDFKSKNETLNIFKYFIIAPIILFIITNTSLHYFNFYQYAPYHNYTNIKLNTQDLDRFEKTITDKNKRVLFIPDQRHLDFYLDSLFISKGYKINWVKGLYWESSLNNLYLNSYIANTLNPSSLVLESVYTLGDIEGYDRNGNYVFDCDKTFKFLENWIKDNNIGYIVLKTTNNLNNKQFIPENKQQCFFDSFEKTTNNFSYKNLGNFDFDGNLNKGFNLIEVKNKNIFGYNNDKIEVYNNYNIKSVNPKQSKFYNDYFYAIKDSNSSSNVENLYLFKDEYNKFIVRNKTYNYANQVTNATIEKINTNKFKINVLSDVDKLFKVKMSYYNGFTLKDKDGKNIPIYNGVMGIYAVGHGEMYLEYSKPQNFYITYILSIIFGLLYLIYVFIPKKKD